MVAGESVLLAGITVVSVMPFSCKITEQGVKIIGGDYVPPVLSSFTVTGEDSIHLEFSEKVNISGYVVAEAVDELAGSEAHSTAMELSPALERAAGMYGSVPCTVYIDESGCGVDIVLEQKMKIGQGYELYTQVTDEAGNTLTLAVPFYGYNDRVPKLLITEIQTESVSSQNKAEKEKGTYRNEFVEILVLGSGNLAGLELCSGYDGETKKYSFPVLEVEAGEVFVVHMRKRGEGCISEEGTDLSLAFSSYTGPEVRDLWTDIESTTLGNKTDVIILRNSADGCLLDAIMYRASEVEVWTKGMIDFSQLAGECGIYESADIENAFVTDGMTGTKTMIRNDAALLCSQALAGELTEYPVKSYAYSWSVTGEASPGSL